MSTCSAIAAHARSALILGVVISAATLPGSLDLSGRQPQPISPDASATVSQSVRVMDLFKLAASMTIAFRYTPRVSGAAGQADIEPYRSALRIHALFRNLPPASRLGPEYLTYTLWQVTSDGRTTNLGEIELTGTDGEIRTKSRSLRFGLMVTAEPYFAVSQPSAAVAFVSDLAPGSSSAVPLSDAKCDLLRTPIGSDLPPAASAGSGNSAAPLIFVEAHHALAVARAAGAAEYASQTLGTATETLQIAEKLLAQGAKKQDVRDAAVEAVLIAEDARVLAVNRQKRSRAAPIQDPHSEPLHTLTRSGESPSNSDRRRAAPPEEPAQISRAGTEYFASSRLNEHNMENLASDAQERCRMLARIDLRFGIGNLLPVGFTGVPETHRDGAFFHLPLRLGI